MFEHISISYSQRLFSYIGTLYSRHSMYPRMVWNLFCLVFYFYNTIQSYRFKYFKPTSEFTKIYYYCFIIIICYMMNLVALKERCIKHNNDKTKEKNNSIIKCMICMWGHSGSVWRQCWMDRQTVGDQNSFCLWPSIYLYNKYI